MYSIHFELQSHSFLSCGMKGQVVPYPTIAFNWLSDCRMLSYFSFRRLVFIFHFLYLVISYLKVIPALSPFSGS